jgi:hydroxymethylpyrimidine/phosphomethylpyrimidine kinase
LKTALTIAGSDPSGGAGIQADIKTFSAFGVRDVSVLASLTAQNTRGVHEIFTVPPLFFSAQLNAILDDLRPDAVKTGMISSVEIIELIAEKIKNYRLINLVIDPVMASTSGTSFMNKDVLAAMTFFLIPMCYLVTPNIKEASILSSRDVTDITSMKEAARVIRDMGTSNVIIKGGHLEGNPVDILWNGREFTFFETERVEGDFHGTGCTFASAITACLARGCDLKTSIQKAKSFLYQAMKRSPSPNTTMKILNLSGNYDAYKSEYL